jgi:hypothetical protein
MTINYCPNCSAYWNAWGEIKEPVKCWSCGFTLDSITRMGAPKIEIIPDSCPDHPKYKAIGKPNSDCPTCWLMYKVAIDKQAEGMINGRV